MKNVNAGNERAAEFQKPKLCATGSMISWRGGWLLQSYSKANRNSRGTFQPIWVRAEADGQKMVWRDSLPTYELLRDDGHQFPPPGRRRLQRYWWSDRRFASG